MFQNKHCRSKGENTMKVTLKDGSVKEYSEPMSVNDIAFDIAGGLGRAACAGEVAYFQREYIKTGIFDKKYSKYVQSVFQIRNSCDYDDFFIASRQDAEEQYQKAEELYEEVKAFLEK